MLIKLVRGTLTPGAMFQPESQKIEMAERSGTCTITLPVRAGVELTPGDWVLDTTEPCAGTVWRVRSVDTTYNTDTQSIQMEHIIATLKDLSVFGDVKARDISGTDTCTAEEAAAYFLDRQDVWQLGDFEYDVAEPFSFNGESVYSALETITSALTDPVWEFDLTAVPFTLHIRHRTFTADCEMRMGRNLSTLRRTVDRGKMYTRIYPIGKKNLHIPGDYISKNEAVYGRVDKIATDQSQDTVQALTAWAAALLDRHAEPTVNITVSGLDFSRATGEPLDAVAVNKVCRVPLPEYGTTILERVVKLSYRDKVREPENVTLTLCNARDDIASFAREQASGGGRGARADAKEKQEDHAWFVDTESHVGMVAEAIIGRDSVTGDVNWSRVSEIIVDGSGIHDIVTRADGSIVTMMGRMDLDEASLSTLFTKTGVNSLGAGQTLYSRIVQTAESISLKVGRDEILAAINMSAESISIQAGKISLDGYVMTGSMQVGGLTATEDIECDVLHCNEVQAVTDIYISDGAGTYTGISGALQAIVSIDDGVEDAQTAGQINFAYTCVDGSTGSFHFDQADTAYLRAQVSAARSEGVNSVRLGEPAWNPVGTPTPGTTQGITVTASNGQTAYQAMQLVAGTGVAYLRSMPSNVTVAQVAVSSPISYGDAELGTFDTTTHKASVTVVDASMDPLTEIAVTAGTPSNNQVPILVNGHDTGLRVSQSSSYSHSARVDTLIDSGFMMQRQSVDYKLYYLTSNGYAALITVGSSASNTLCIMSSLMQQSRTVYW